MTTPIRRAQGPLGFERNNVLFHHGPERLVIGELPQLARGGRFIMGSASHGETVCPRSRSRSSVASGWIR